MEFPMLAKCITPSCDSQFKYFGRGVLMIKKSSGAPAANDAELFWMCDECARRSLAPQEFVAVSRAVPAKTDRARRIAA
jgi:hypothetical protein